MSFLSFFTEFVFLIGLGTISSISSSAPIGPANLWVAGAVIQKKRFSSIVAFTFGIIVIDLVYSYLAFWGYHVYLQGTSFNRWFGIVGGVGLALLGVYEFWTVYHPRTENQVGLEVAGKQTLPRDFLMGAFLCGSNPAFIFFWVMVAKVAADFGVADFRNAKALLIFFGIILGDLIWYSFFYKLVKKGIRLLSLAILRYIRYGIAIGLILMGLTAAFGFSDHSPSSLN